MKEKKKKKKKKPCENNTNVDGDVVVATMQPPNDNLSLETLSQVKLSRI